MSNPGHVGPPAGLTIADTFNTFHNANPHVYAELVTLARRARARGARRIGIGMLFEVVRWRSTLRTGSDDDFKLNNNHRALYARLIMDTEPDLAGIFETRTLHAPTRPPEPDLEPGEQGCLLPWPTP